MPTFGNIFYLEVVLYSESDYGYFFSRQRLPSFGVFL